MSNKQRVNVAPTSVLEGEPEDLAQQFAERFVLELAIAVSKTSGVNGVFEFYTALTSCVLCQARIALGREVAELIGQECTKAAINATEPTQPHGVH